MSNRIMSARTPSVDLLWPERNDLLDRQVSAYKCAYVGRSMEGDGRAADMCAIIVDKVTVMK